MSYDVNKVIAIAEAEVGYLEKKSNSKLTGKIENAGKNNYTKYWKDLAPGMNGQSWCNCFINWCFVKAYGEKAAKELLCTKGGWSYYTPTSADYFKKNKQWFTSSPKVGDIIYFKNTQRICHVGLVYKVDKSKVYTIEGNTTAGSGVVANGGGVAKKSYALSNNKIAGYGRPSYTAGKAPTAPKLKNPYKEPTVDIKKGSKGVGVEWVQWELNQEGARLDIDGEAGNLTDQAIRAYQKKHKLTENGVVNKIVREEMKKH